MKNSSNIFTNRFLYILIKHLLPIFILSSKLPLQKTFAISLHVISINFRIFRSKHTPSKSLQNFSKSPHKSHKLILVRNPRVSRRRRREFLRISLTKWRRRKRMMRNQWTIVDPFPPRNRATVRHFRINQRYGVASVARTMQKALGKPRSITRDRCRSSSPASHPSFN